MQAPIQILNFPFEPESGWGVMYFFTDYESQLLIVVTNLIDKSQWKNLEFGGQEIPTKKYVIDLKKQKILLPKEWKLYFSYEPIELFYENDQYQLIRQRMHDEENNTDFFEEKLIETASGKTLSSSKSVAFHDKKSENLWKKRQKQQEQEKIWVEKRKNDPEQFCGHCGYKVTYTPRYPNYLCSDCCAKLTDSEGRAVVFSNVAYWGGCEGSYKGSAELYNSNIAYIGEKQFIAIEGRFGGIVIRPYLEEEEGLFW